MNSGAPDPGICSSVYALETERLLLRPMQEIDAEALYEVMSNHDSMRYWSCAPHTKISQTMDFIKSSISGSSADYYDFSILLKQNSPSSPPKFIGKIGVWRHGVGFLLHPSMWRKGIASEAMKVFLGQYWETHPEIGTLQADVDPRNEASLGLLGKFGFREASRAANTYLTHLGWCDSVYLMLDRPEVESGCIV